jgi:hypothetical protein
MSRQMSAQQQSTVDLRTTLDRWRTAPSEALALAVARDLRRFDRALSGPVTAVRRQALIGHLGFVLDRMTDAHRLLDTAVWPAAAALEPELADLAEELRTAHVGLTWPVSELRATARQWARTPENRADLLSTLRETAPRLQRVLDRDAELLPIAAHPLGDWTSVELARAAAESRLPTVIARRLFWLLDDLDDDRAALLLRGTPSYRLWILRNGFSGAYNRSAYLMWVGGGDGPAV